MNFLIITRKQILIFILLLAFVFCFVIYCTCYAKENTCSGSYIFSIASENDFTIITDLQDKLDDIYSSDEKGRLIVALSHIFALILNSKSSIFDILISKT